jgi:hypothetical protein
MAGYTLKNQIRITVIRNELSILNLNNIIQNSSLQLMDYTPKGTRSIGCSKLRWKDQPICLSVCFSVTLYHRLYCCTDFPNIRNWRLVAKVVGKILVILIHNKSSFI